MSSQRLFGRGRPCLVIAEIGINHNGSLDLAKAMIDAAKAAGADAVKFQNYRIEDFLSDRSLTYDYVSQGRKVGESQWDMFKRCELDREKLGAIAAHCRKVGIRFGSTPTATDGVADLVALGADFLKNGSDFLSHLPLIETMAKSGLPTILSTGMATQDDVADAVSAYRGAGGAELAVLHCVSSYPAPPAALNLRRMQTLAHAFGCAVGFSDHSEGTSAASAAVAMGACIVEKHFTTDRNLPGPDQRFSSDPAEFAELVRGIRATEAMLGEARIVPSAAEQAAREGYRLSCVAARDLPEGAIVTAADVRFRRPGSGLPPKALPELLGRRLRRAHRAGEVFAQGDVA
jgi:sialic acid synthase SpsE